MQEQLREECMERVHEARKATAYTLKDLGAVNQKRFLMRMRLYHTAATIVGSMSEDAFRE
jgi:hypothetical protein